jgi:hypothetical protein
MATKPTIKPKEVVKPKLFADVARDGFAAQNAAMADGNYKNAVCVDWNELEKLGMAEWDEVKVIGTPSQEIADKIRELTQ